MSAVAELPPDPLPPPPTTGPLWWQRLSALNRAQRMRLGAGVALLVLAAVAALVLGHQPDYRVLFGNLSDKDGGTIVAQLSQMNVPYRLAEGGGAILVPADRVHEVRLRLASQGLPKGSVVGFELMESSKFGVTQFQERLNFRRGLEGELTRSIQALSPVQSARVHLALPEQNGFFREQQKPSASVLVSLYPGRFLERAQLAGIVHLVAASVPEMAPSAVSVLDDTGKLLSRSPDGAADAEVNAQQLLHVQRIEQQYTRRILDILEPVVGRDNVKAQVTADVDFTQTESSSEQFRPNQQPESGAVRSQQLLESRSGANKLPTGIPGAVSNQPPVPSTAPINGPNPAPNAGGQQGPDEQTNKRESTTNYELDRTVRVVRGSTGTVKRLSAAVVVNYQSVLDKGRAVSRALTPEQIGQMTALVRESIGFDSARGDSVNLMNTPFQLTVTPPEALAWWQRPALIDLAKTLAWPVGALLFAALVLLGLVWPVLRPPRAVAGRQLDALEAETPERPALPAPIIRNEPLLPTPEQLRLQEARALARENPAAVANILKTWLSGEPA
ncbi:flagellar basal-body MS-ring/collar protein FliF [Verminephrobacter eiseniae]|nr:flagellar basal-body MS-ring/collar protein FliF [Verminephrobacter eiseniae]MCW5287233.1 flagellar basal body M-ring protein FliF [Verminephrobacter eiseniae]MCW5305532.1 flagellar basal body M-ring protein FliF [Verminephrobacter eiseniae]MCW8180367.1 flagellar basal body M-ring protein FliF [Verminephrobacter eiseniae]MCW8191427.1 flagellar basal body M-ring protein FliF [Verminephrobacter eiseniae]